jgi:hypothetical protein
VIGRKIVQTRMGVDEVGCRDRGRRQA